MSQGIEKPCHKQRLFLNLKDQANSRTDDQNEEQNT